MNEIETLRADVESLQANRVALTLIVVALMQTHPHQEHLQLLLTSSLEQQLNGGALGGLLNERQKAVARDTVEWLQTIKPRDAQKPLRRMPGSDA